MRLHIDAVVGKHRRGLRKLHQGKGVVALPDCHRDRFAGIPALLLAFLVGIALPFGGRQDAPLFALDIDPGELSETEGLHKIVQGIDADFRPKRIEIGVGRNNERAVHVERPISGCARIAESLAAELVIPGVVDDVCCATTIELERRQSHERLVG